MIDHGVTPLPPNRASYYAEDQPSLRDRLEADLDHAARRSELHRRRQPRATGRSGSSASRSIPYEGLVLHQVAYDDDGRRPFDPAPCVDQRDGRAVRRPERPLHGWKNAFDAGEWGLGRMTQPLTLGCDCLGEIHYFDATLANEQGEPWVIANAICMHEEDYGILWKHVDLYGRSQRGAAQPPARRQLRRDRRQLRVRLLLVLLPRRQHPTRGEAHRHRVADGDRAGNAARVRQRHRRGRRGAAPPAPVQRPPRLRRRRSGERGLRGRGRTRAARSRQPVGERVPRRRRRGSTRELARAARRRRGVIARVADRESRRAQRARTTGRLQARARRCRRRRCSPHPDSSVGRRAGFAQHNLWVTPYAPRRTARRGRVPQPARRAATVCRAGRRDDRTHRRHRRRVLVLVRRHALRSPRGLAGHAGRVHRLPPHARRLLRPQPRRSTFAPRRRHSTSQPTRHGARMHGQWTREELQRAHDNFIATAQESGRTGDWGPWADAVHRGRRRTSSTTTARSTAATRSRRGSPRRWRSGRTRR